MVVKYLNYKQVNKFYERLRTNCKLNEDYIIIRKTNPSSKTAKRVDYFLTIDIKIKNPKSYDTYVVYDDAVEYLDKSNNVIGYEKISKKSSKKYLKNKLLYGFYLPLFNRIFFHSNNIYFIYILYK